MATGNNSIFVPDGKNAIHDGIEHEPGGGKALLDPTDTALLLLDHQSGLFQNVKDITVAELRANTTALAKLATLHQIPVILTASVPDGPNGPLMPEIREAAPHAVYVPRKGEVNAAGVNIQRVAQIFHGHGGAFDVPAGTPRPDARFPEMFARLGRFP